MLKRLKFKSQFILGARWRKHISEPRFLLGSIPRQSFLILVTAQTKAIFMADDSKHLIPPLPQTAWGRLKTITCLDSKRPQKLLISNELFIVAPKCFLLLDLFSSPILPPVLCFFGDASRLCSATYPLCLLQSEAQGKPLRENVKLLLGGEVYIFQ